MVEQLLGVLARLIEVGDKDGSMVKAEELLGLGIEPRQIVEVAIVGALFGLDNRCHNGEATPEDMIAAGRAAKAVLAILERHLPMPSGGASGSLVLAGTVEGDIHDLGKDALAMLLRARGMEVADLGAGVPVMEFIDTIRARQPAGLALSCHVTSLLADLRRLINAAKEMEPSSPIVALGGSAIDPGLAPTLGADIYAVSVWKGAEELARVLL